MFSLYKCLSFISWVFLCPQLLGALPVTQIQNYPEEIASFFEGDIILTEHQAITKERNVVSDRKYLWPNKTLTYELSDEFHPLEKMWIQMAIASLQRETCVRFEARTDEKDYVYVRKQVGCAAAVGFNAGRVEMYLSLPGCLKWGTIQHEFLHALGFWHEHTRYDRDNYIAIQWQNIIKGLENNFVARRPEESQFEGLPYDFGSVMHYRETTFSRNQSLPTIIPLYKNVKMGQREKFSKIDLAKLNRLYECGSNFYQGDDIGTQSTATQETETTSVDDTDSWQISTVSNSWELSTVPSGQMDTRDENIIEESNYNKKRLYKNINKNALNKLFRAKRQVYFPQQYEPKVPQYVSNERDVNLRTPSPPVPQYWHNSPAESGSCPCQHDPRVWCTKRHQPSYHSVTLQRTPRQQLQTDFESPDSNNTSAETYDADSVSDSDKNSVTQYVSLNVSHKTENKNDTENVRPTHHKNQTRF